jgi:hypothetical protein
MLLACDFCARFVRKHGGLVHDPSQCLWPGHASAARWRETLREIVEAHHHEACVCGSLEIQPQGPDDELFRVNDSRCEQERAAARGRLT